ncbi:arrestin domain-containing protein 3-like [Planoprotostelium fungivorum]|uniref:Arrestin domain-containing protein 3-like n=1 Tax=Planoprotostelium fungivorum TaxID=1890364 RepID=A0A2P6NNP8_9EUKA|nr:arrestin domain-containing protein 3-like [Planoprotostelium fungivorum]
MVSRWTADGFEPLLDEDVSYKDVKFQDHMHVFLDKLVYLTGESVTGRLVVKNEHPLHCLSLVISLENKIHTHYTEGSGENTTHYNGREKAYKHSITLHSTECNLPTGYIVYPFTFPPLERQGMSTFEHLRSNPSLRSYWRIKTVIERPGALTKNLRHRQHFSVCLDGTVVASKPISKEHLTKSPKPSWNHIPVCAKLNIEENTLKMGSEVKVEVVIDNSSDKKLDHYTVSFERILLHRFSGTKMQRVVCQNLVEVRGEKIDKCSAVQRTVSFMVPTELVAACETKYADIKYVVRLTVKKPGLFHGPVVVPLDPQEVCLHLSDNNIRNMISRWTVDGFQTLSNRKSNYGKYKFQDHMHIFLDKLAYHTGDSVTGRLVVKNERPLHCTSLVMSLENKIHTHSTEGSEGDKKKYDGREKAHRHSITMHSAECDLPAGYVVYPFAFPPLEHQGMSTFENRSSRHSLRSYWRIKTVISRPGTLTKNLRYRRYFSAISGEHLTKSPTPTWNHIPVCAKLNIAKSTIKMGSRVKVEVVIDNSSDKKLDYYTVSLERVLVLRFSDTKTEKIVCQKVPTDMVCASKTTFADLHYVIYLTVEKPGLFHGPVIVSLPVNITR